MAKCSTSKCAAKQTAETSDCFTVREVSQMLKCNEKTVRSLVENPDSGLESFRIGGPKRRGIRITKESLDRLMQGGVANKK